MNKMLLKDNNSLNSFFDYQNHLTIFKHHPEHYPCLVVYDVHDNPNGKDWLIYEFVYLNDFQ